MLNLENNYLQPDRWNIGETITKADDWSDSGFPGCEYRIMAGSLCLHNFAINLSISGRNSFPVEFGRYRTRVKIEFVGDCEPSTFSHGWLYTEHPLIEG